MRRAAVIVTVASAMLLSAASAQAAAPTVTDSGATDIQGVSALLHGEVNPEGLVTSYRFEYVSDGAFAQGGFTGAARTPLTPVGAGTAPHPARAAISGLAPGTTYHYLLVAANSSGVASAGGTFTTTAGFGLRPGGEGFAAEAVADGGGASTQAGSHPYRFDLGLHFNLGGEFEDQPGAAFPDGDPRDLAIQLPPGFIVNAGVVGGCSAVEFAAPRSSPFEESSSGESCPEQSQVGTASVDTARDGGTPRRFGVFSLTPPPGVLARFGFAPYGEPVVLDLALREVGPGSFGLALEAADIPQALDLSGLSLSLWGAPWAASHDGERGNCLNEAEPAFPWAKCSVGRPQEFPPLALLTLPGRCSASLGFEASADAWQQPAAVRATALSEDVPGAPAPLGSCAGLGFGPRPVGLLNDTKASSPAGYNFRLQNDDPNLTDPDRIADSPLRQVVVRLPQGVTINPSVGAGLTTCSPAQFAVESAASPVGAGCPDGAKIGDFSVRTPLSSEALAGSIYLATPDDPTEPVHGAQNPFDTLVAVYLVAKAPARGLQVKLAGRIDADPGSGNLVATFDGLPQLPYSDLDLTFRAGQRSFLITPAACGPAVSRIELTPWAEGAATVAANSATPIQTGVEGGPCPAGPPPFTPGVRAGALNSNVGSYTPYFIHLTRKDTEQEITSYSLVLPKGITGKLAGIPYCPDADIAAARGRQGVAETASPSCPAASQVGRTLTGYGVGGALTYAPGRIFLAGPYHGAPLSLVTINSATVGPFDLGTIVIRSAFDIDPLTAQLQIDSAASDPIPHIIDGIPLHLRDVRIYIDRPEFTHNPSSCEPSVLASTLTGSGARFADPTDDSTASAGSPFQLLNCLTLGFRPKLGIRLRGSHRRGGYPSLRATFAARGPQDSNLKRIEVTLPHSEFLAQNHIRTICTRPQFDAERCPPGSVYGKAVAYTPLFDQPLRGDVYLRSSKHRLPDLVASLRSGAIRIVLEGRIGPAKQGIRTLFDELPDAPISRFTLTLNGGRRGLLVNSADICKAPPLATVKALGQNNIGASFSTRLRGQCGSKGKGKGGKK